MKIKNKIILIFSMVFVLILNTIVSANTYVLPPEDQNIIGSVKEIIVGRDTTLSDEARRYNVGFNEIRLANPGIDPWLPQNGSRVILPTRYLIPDTPRRGIVINVPEMRLYFFRQAIDENPPVIVTHPISIGRGDWETPLGDTTIISKTLDPAWRPPESIRNEHAEQGDYLPEVVPAGPDNPLGKHALRLGLPGYLIHGTSKPYGIGMRVTHGCIRLYPEDIEALFDQIKIGTLVKIIHQPYKFGTYLDTLYMEAHLPFEGHESSMLDIKLLYDAVTKFNQKLEPKHEIDWQDALRIARNPTGIPVPVKILSKQPLYDFRQIIDNRKL